MAPKSEPLQSLWLYAYAGTQKYGNTRLRLLMYILGFKRQYQQTVRHGDFQYGLMNEAWWSRSELEPLMTNMTREGHP